MAAARGEDQPRRHERRHAHRLPGAANAPREERSRSREVRSMRDCFVAAEEQTECLRRDRQIRHGRRSGETDDARENQQPQGEDLGPRRPAAQAEEERREEGLKRKIAPPERRNMEPDLARSGEAPVEPTPGDRGARPKRFGRPKPKPLPLQDADAEADNCRQDELQGPKAKSKRRNMEVEDTHRKSKRRRRESKQLCDKSANTRIASTNSFERNDSGSHISIAQSRADYPIGNVRTTDGVLDERLHEMEAVPSTSACIVSDTLHVRRDSGSDSKTAAETTVAASQPMIASAEAGVRESRHDRKDTLVTASTGEHDLQPVSGQVPAGAPIRELGAGTVGPEAGKNHQALQDTAVLASTPAANKPNQRPDLPGLLARARAAAAARRAGRQRAALAVPAVAVPWQSPAAARVPRPTVFEQQVARGPAQPQRPGAAAAAEDEEREPSSTPTAGGGGGVEGPPPRVLAPPPGAWAHGAEAGAGARRYRRGRQAAAASDSAAAPRRDSTVAAAGGAVDGDSSASGADGHEDEHDTHPRRCVLRGAQEADLRARALAMLGKSEPPGA